MTLASQAIAKLQAILAERGDVRVVVGPASGPALKRDVEDIREDPPYDDNDGYDPTWRAVVEVEE